MTTNRLVLTGTVCQKPIRKVSPSGIPHCQFVMIHESQQQEAGLNRQAWCRMPIVVSGHQLQAITHHIKVGCKILVQGFICHHQGRNGLGKIVLHAEQIELLNSGE